MPISAIAQNSLQKHKLGLPIAVFYSVFVSPCLQSDLDSNRMFHNASLMICWFGAIPPVACLPLGSRAAGAWWKGCDEKSGIISFLVRCHTELSGWFMIQRGETWPGLWFTAVRSQSCANSSRWSVWGAHSTLSFTTNKCKCLLAVRVYTSSVCWNQQTVWKDLMSCFRHHAVRLKFKMQFYENGWDFN